jgi:hypothetical protein
MTGQTNKTLRAFPIHFGARQHNTIQLKTAIVFCQLTGSVLSFMTS